jgi:hypothetical protein
MSVVNIGIQVIIGLVSIVAAALIGTVWKFTQRGKVYWKAWRFWRPFLLSDVTVVVDKFDKFPDWEPSGLVGVGGMQATVEIRALLDDLGLRGAGRNVKIIYSDQAQGNLHESNLVCIGGPDANCITRLITDRLNYTLSLGIPDDNDITIRDLSDGGKSFLPDEHWVGEKKVVTQDHGVIIKVKNPFNQRRRVLIVAGTYGYGTWAAAKLLHGPQFLNEDFVKRGYDIECLSRAKIFDGIPQDPEIILPLRQISVRHDE